jgi:hypothetical protein
MDDEILKDIDDWRRGQEDLPPRAEAVRRLVHRGVKLDALSKHLMDLLDSGSISQNVYQDIIRRI